MKPIHAMLLIAAAMGLHSAALALDQSPKVEAKTILKAQASWDGSPIVYPRGSRKLLA